MGKTERVNQPVKETRVMEGRKEGKVRVVGRWMESRSHGLMGKVGIYLKTISEQLLRKTKE